MDRPQVGILGGTGLGDALGRRLKDVTLENVQTPFGRPSGPILIGTLGANRIAFLSRHGPGHRFNPSQVPYAANIFALKKLGVTSLIASGAVGSLQSKIAPRDLVLVDQFIDKTFRRQNTFFDQLGAVHVEFSHPCCRRLREKLQSAAKHISASVHPDGTYVCMEGPQFSSRAESLIHRRWGADLIGMTALPEAKLAREAQMCYALVALVSDYDCWREHSPDQSRHSLLQEILGNLNEATENAIGLIERLLETDGGLAEDCCDCRKALELAVWTGPDALDPQAKAKLSILFD